MISTACGTISRKAAILAAFLFIFIFATSITVAAPPTDDNFWYQTITINSNTSVTDGLYHAWVDFPYNWSDGNYASYRLYYDNGTDVPFHIFSANGSQISLSFKANMSAGNNTFYLSAGNFSLPSVQTTSVYGNYADLTNITGNTTYSVSAYNFAQIVGNHYSYYNVSGAYVSYNFNSGSENVSFRVDRNNVSNRAFSITNSGATVESVDLNSSINVQTPYFYAIDSISGNTNAYLTVYGLDQTGAGSFSVDLFEPISSQFNGSSISVSALAYTNTTIKISYAAGNYSSYDSISISSPIATSTDFLVVSMVDFKTGEIYAIDGRVFNASNTSISSFGANYYFYANITSTYITPDTLFGKTIYTNVGNFSINNWTKQEAINNTSKMNARTFTYVIQERPSVISLILPSYVNATIPLDFNGTHIKIPFMDSFSWNVSGKSVVYTLVLDSDGNLLPAATVEYYAYGSQFESSVLSSATGIAAHAGYTNTNYAVYAEKRDYGNSSAQMVTTANHIYTTTKGVLLFLDQKDNVSITVRDYDTLEIIGNYTSYFGENQRLKSTDNGTVEYDNVTNGIYDVVLVAENYNQVTRKVTVTSTQRDFTLYMTKSDNGSSGGNEQVTTPQYITYYVRNMGNIPIPNVQVSVYETGSDELLMSKMTGTDGSVTFSFNRTLTYKVEFSYGSETESVNISGSQSSYYIVYLNVSTPGPDVSLQERLRASMRVSSINNSSVIISATIVDDRVSENFEYNISYSIDPFLDIYSVQYGTGFVIVSYIIDRSVYDSWAEANQTLVFSATVYNSSESAELRAVLTITISGSDLINIEIPDGFKLGIIIGASVLLVLGTAAFNTASISYIAALIPLLFGRWILWIDIPVSILILLVGGLILVLRYDMWKQDK